MPRGLPQTIKDNLEKCRSATLAAVEVYNKPGPRFRTAHYLVLITIAWTALFHAIFYKRGRRPWYRSPTSGTGTGIRYQKIDGEPKHWDLSKCLAEYYGSQNPPERKNLEFLLGLRNKIEHRHLPELDASLYGECQAALLNLEQLLVAQFGKRYALSEYLAISLQFSQIMPAEKKRTARALAGAAAKSVADYVTKFRGGLPTTTLNSIKYSFNVFLVPKVANRESAADVAVEFIRVDEASDEELDRLDKLNILIREKQIPIQNLDLLKASQVVSEVAQHLSHRMNLAVHTECWRHFQVRPPTRSSHPERTLQQYCVYDRAHRDYLYTRAWIEKLTRELRDPADFARIVGRPPQPREGADS